MKTFKLSFGCAIFVALSCHSLSAQNVPTMRMAPPAASVNSAPATHEDSPHPGFAGRNPRYRINRSDVLMISFALSPELNQKVTVAPDGFITLQGAGSINILGLTAPETVEAIKQAYAKTLHDPIVDVDLLDFQKDYFVVSGQVNKPGQYDLRYDLTVAEAIALAGGFMSTAKTRVYLYHRSSAGWVEAKELNLNDFLHGKNVEEDVGVRPGDMIYVPEKAIARVRKYIPYSLGMGSGVYY
jgi:polysaccharide biosynthesis/export protein